MAIMWANVRQVKARPVADGGPATPPKSPLDCLAKASPQSDGEGKPVSWQLPAECTEDSRNPADDPIMGFLPPSDKRVHATVLAIADDLTKDDLVLRYRVETTDDGLSGEEGTFTICSFWLVSALAMIGEVDRARALFEKLLSFAGPLLLYAEEIDTTTGQHLGNFPQAFTHLALIDAAQRLIAAESAAE